MYSKSYNVISLIKKKRDEETLTPGEISYLIDRYSNDQLPDYQMSAFLMAVFLNKLNEQEAAALTYAMLQSGKILDLSNIPGKKVDKHSTGGVGDKISLILAPVVASYGISVPMIASRGLGHTGGTLDKLESIPGFATDISLDRYQHILRKCGVIIAGQTEDTAPADKRLYALRDVTGTVESIPLIASSIMSKKLVEDIDALVLDVKFGSGAFMKTKREAQKLARSLVGIGEDFGKETVAYLTNMDQPLGYKIGNWLEVEEAIEALHGKGPDDVMEVTYMLAGTMIMMGDKAKTIEEGIHKSKTAIENGKAFDKWLKLTEAQGGDIEMLKNPGKYRNAEHSFTVEAQNNGYISGIDAYQTGMASMELGAGRKTKDDDIDYIAGIVLNKKVGNAVKKGETLCVGFTNKDTAIEAAKDLLRKSYMFSVKPPVKQPMITHRIAASGIHKL